MDPVLIGLVALMAASWGVAGFQVCRMTHRQRGVEVDDWEVVVPDRPLEGAGR